MLFEWFVITGFDDMFGDRTCPQRLFLHRKDATMANECFDYKLLIRFWEVSIDSLSNPFYDLDGRVLCRLRLLQGRFNYLNPGGKD